MSEDQSEDKSRDRGIPIVIDGYGIKVTLESRPDHLDETPPATWAEVRERVGQHLMRIAVAPTALIATVLESTTRIVSGLSRIPNSLSRAIKGAHSAADERERELQARAGEEKKSRVTIPKFASTNSNAILALTQIEALVAEYKAKGVDAYVLIGPNGQIIVALGTASGSEAEVLDAIRKAKALLEEPMEYSG